MYGKEKSFRASSSVQESNPKMRKKYGKDVALTAKGYFYDGPTRMGKEIVVYNWDHISNGRITPHQVAYEDGRRVLSAIHRLSTSAEARGQAVQQWQAFKQFADTPDGGGEIAFNAVFIVTGGEQSLIIAARNGGDLLGRLAWPRMPMQPVCSTG